MNWRRENNIDSLLSTYTVPEVLKKYYAEGLVGEDKEGCPVWIFRIGKIDYCGLLNRLTPAEMETFMIWIVEKTVQHMKDLSEKLGKPVETVYDVVDTEGFTLKQLASLPVLRIFKKITTICDLNYPEILKKAVIINAPALVRIPWAMMQPFISDVSLRKMTMYGQTGWKEILLSDIDADVLPVQWGGTRTDSTGKPWCPTIIPEGGQIPEDEFPSHIK